MADPDRAENLTDLLNAFAGDAAIVSPDGRGLEVEVLYERCRAIVKRVKMRASSLADFGTTDLLHRAWERTLLAQGDDAPARRWNSREHFFATLAKATVESIIDERRHREAEKRGGGQSPRRITQGPEPSGDRRRALDDGFDGEDRVTLRRALDEFAKIDPRACTVVVLRSFWEFSISEIAASLGISERSVNRDWLAARAWLGKRLRELDGQLPDRSPRGVSAPNDRQSGDSS